MRSNVRFGRTYPFYVLIKNKPIKAYSFLVTVTALKKIDKMTGMSVDLRDLDQIFQQKLRTKAINTESLIACMKDIVLFLKTQLKLKNTLLDSVCFQECRGDSYFFKKGQFYLSRKDFATDAKGDLYQVESYFNRKNKLIQIEINNLKLGLCEQFIFSNDLA